MNYATNKIFNQNKFSSLNYNIWNKNYLMTTLQRFLTKYHYIITSNPNDYVLQNKFLLEYYEFSNYTTILTEAELLSIGICAVHQIRIINNKHKKVLTGIKYED